MKNRIKEIRKSLGLNQTDFGARVGVKGNTIGNYEVGLRNPSEAVIFSICREFNVNEHWLRTGEGDMFLTLPPEDEYIKAAAEISKDPDDEIIRQIIIEYWKLNPEGKKHLKEFIHNIIQNINKEE